MSAMTTGELASKSCVPCKGDTPKLKGAELERYAAAVPDWQVVRGHQLERSYKFPDFRSALAFTNRVGELAEAQNHHPDLTLSWGKVGVTLWTHAIDGLSESDFVLAAKIESLPREAAQ